MQFRSILKPEGSVMAGLAVAGTVYAIYNQGVGPLSQAHNAEANHPALESGRKKAGYTSFIFVSAIGLITKDTNVLSLGYGSIIAMEVLNRNAIMADPETGKLQQPTPPSYVPATVDAAVVPMPSAAGVNDYGYTAAS